MRMLYPWWDYGNKQGMVHNLVGKLDFQANNFFKKQLINYFFETTIHLHVLKAKKYKSKKPFFHHCPVYKHPLLSKQCYWFLVHPYANTNVNIYIITPFFTSGRLFHTVFYTWIFFILQYIWRSFYINT